MGWMMMNKLKFVLDKTEVLCISKQADQELEISSVLDRVTVPLKSQVLSLKVLLSTVATLENPLANCGSK